MKRAGLLALVAVLSLAQRSRDDYRAAYRVWREADPNLEREAALGGPSIAQRADRMAAEAAKCATVRKAFLSGVADDQKQQVAWLEYAKPVREPMAASTLLDSQFLASETESVTRTIDTFANESDKGIQQLRVALARERIALDGLSRAITLRQKSVDIVNTAAEKSEQAIAKALEQSRDMLKGWKDAEADTTREAAAWVEYYRKIAEGSSGPATPITAVEPGVATVVVNNPVQAPATITPVPLARYVGAWTFPQTNGVFHGAQPEFIDVLVQEENGHIKGTLVGRFKQATGDPVVRFDFMGDLQPTRNQVFTFANGAIELIPGSAFNLLQVRFHTDSKQGDAELVKK